MLKLLIQSRAKSRPGLTCKKRPKMPTKRQNSRNSCVWTSIWCRIPSWKWPRLLWKNSWILLSGFCPKRPSFRALERSSMSITLLKRLQPWVHRKTNSLCSRLTFSSWITRCSTIIDRKISSIQYISTSAKDWWPCKKFPNLNKRLCPPSSSRIIICT